MKKPWIFLLALAFAGAAQAQLYKWVDKDGKTRYGDTPPPGVKASVMGAPASGSASAPAASSDPASKDAKKGPLTPAEQAQEFRKRQDDAKKEAEKEAQERKDKAAKAEDCVRNKEYLMSLQSGQRIARTNPSTGERYYMDDSQRAQEVASAQQAMKNCPQ
ncbi:MAG TPA: DUF4124 domain-containing protein [Burkholderiales bacterium]|jgi:hypothetical protein